MVQQEFNRLADVCDGILKDFLSDDAIIANPWLHVLNGHPNSIAQYSHAFKRRGVLSATRLILKNLGYIFLKLVQSIVEFRRNTVSRDIGHADVLFISHLVSLQGVERDRDFYFSTLPFTLKAATGKSAVIGLVDHTPSQKSVVIRGKLEEGETPRIIFLKTLSFGSEISFAYKCIRSYFTLRSQGNHLADQTEKNILNEVALYAMSPATLAALRIQKQVALALERTKASHLVFTWEGRSWERLAISAARKSGRDIKCVGYQHTILLASSHALKKSLGNSYDPDHILTIGKETAANISGAGELTGTTIESFGSYRLAPSNATPAIQEDIVSQCLVAPEGIESECELLFDLAVSAAECTPAVQFVFRMHPVLPFNRFSDKYARFKQLPSNCSLSTEPDINMDFATCQFLLYRGSSVSIYAAKQGLRPVYYRLPGEISIDPLYQLNDWRINISSAAEFLQVVEEHNQMTSTEKKSKRDAARAFCSGYIQVPNEEVFYKMIR